MGILLLKSKTFGKKEVLFDDSDFDLISKYTWYLFNNRTTFYARTSFSVRKGKRRWIFMHNLVTGTLDCNLTIDHKNRNGLDNRKLNLRACTHKENIRNQGIPKNNTTGYKGVYKIYNGYKSTISVNQKRIHIGCFKDPVDAAKAYNNAAKEHFGEFARINVF